ncbi:ferrous iron transport protein B [Clostridiaceae bacterium HSG29]|nr:ferrous iron transport protein B [Clostridiaceae bacterium HSG29]
MNKINAVLVGNPNSGKTTLFNRLTGSKHHVGNWPGVTVDKKEGTIVYNNNEINLVDLPGIYSIFPFSIEEKISREYILENEVDVIINIVNASNLERNLYLTLQLLELGKPVILALNMMDSVEKKGIEINLKKLEEELSIKAIPIIAVKDVGKKELLDSITEISNDKTDFKINYGEHIEELISKYMIKYQDYDERWIAIKTIENDEVIKDIIKHDFDEDYTNQITSKKYDYIDGLLEKVIEYKKSNYIGMTDYIDKVTTHKYFGIPLFLMIMAFVFFLTFNFGGIFVEKLDFLFNDVVASFVDNTLVKMEVFPWLRSLIVDGIIGGVGGVLVFVPTIAILFIFITILEDSGYMARAAFIMDKWMRKIGLNGKSFIPMIMGFGCNVPAIMSTKALEDENDRLVAILINPFMSCGARLPVYAFLSAIFFKGYEAVVTFSLYLLGVLIAILMAFIFKKTLFKSEESPFIMELPDYNIPNVKSVSIHVWEKVKGYIINAGTVIFVASVLLWFALNYNFAGPSEFVNSFGAMIGKSIAPIFAPLGFGDWRAALTLLSGAIAKEIVVANMHILFGNTMNLIFTPLSAYSFMVFVLLYVPCVATIGTIKRETNSWKWMFFSIFYQMIVAWTVSMLIYQIGLLIF